MTRFIRNRLFKKRSHKVGLSPGSLVFTGDAKTDSIRLAVIDYDPDHYEERTLAAIEEAFPFRDQATTSWIDLDGVHNVEVVRQIGEHYGIHPLVMEDIVSTGQRTKAEAYDDHLYLVVKMIYYDDVARQLTVEQVSLVVGPTFVISFQERPGDVFELVRERLRQGTGRLRRRGPDYLAYALLDVIVDHYFVALETISDQIEDLEADILEDPGPKTQQAMSVLRRELILLRKAVWPVRELLSTLERSDSNLIKEETKPFLRDAYDHAVQVIDIVESLRDMVGVLRDSYQAILGNRMNEIMKVLTIIATIFIPLTFIAGIYGMNFDHMPELHMRFGYPIALAAMFAVGIALALYFKWKRWF